MNPSPTGVIGFVGRDDKGQFVTGNKAGRGNPLNKRVQKLRAAMVRSVGKNDLTAIVKAMVDAAKGGDVSAARELFDRVLGKSWSADLEARLSALEELLKERENNEP